MIEIAKSPPGSRILRALLNPFVEISENPRDPTVIKQLIELVSFNLEKSSPFESDKSPNICHIFWVGHALLHHKQFEKYLVLLSEEHLADAMSRQLIRYLHQSPEQTSQ